uniref:Transcriptional regulator of filamentous growth FLO8 n=1 Tax=Ganoderma boninense TaxID=34458 RepID=A0A5K1JZQ0_9APHY|nr:Transcriptional regulator of filamentous growth FLO8 [Ganoderma boninense]
MADVPAASQSQQSSRPRVRHIETLPDARPTAAFGFVLDGKCRRRLARTLIEEYLEDGDGVFSREECEDMLKTMVTTIIGDLPDHVYLALPDLPRIRQDLLPVADKKHGFKDFVFALKDNSTSWRLHAPLTQAIIEAVRKVLGLPDDQQPKWVRVAVYVSVFLKTYDYSFADFAVLPRF